MKLKFIFIILSVSILLLAGCGLGPTNEPTPTIKPKEVLSYNAEWHEWSPVNGKEITIDTDDSNFIITLKSVGIVSVYASDENGESVETTISNSLTFDSNFQITNEPCEYVWMYEQKTPFFLQNIEFSGVEARQINVSVNIYNRTLTHTFKLILK